MPEHLEYSIVKSKTFFSLPMHSIFYKLLFALISISLSFICNGQTTLPENLQWQTNNSDPLLGSENAKRGGRFSSFLLSYPLTFRTVGPDSNSSFRGAILENQLGLTTYHPLTGNIIPQLATHWAYDDDGRTVYYRLNPKARWSDGEPVTADDYVFGLEFMRSKAIVAPWYNNHYSQEIEQLVKYDDYTISITGHSVKPPKDLHYYYGVPPKPKHFHVLDDDWVKAYNWRIEPNTGPYQIERFKTGKFIEFKRKKDWWANDERYFKRRYNPDIIRFQVIRDIDVAYNYFEKGYLDSYGLILPKLWENKTKREIFTRGLAHKVTFYTNTFQPSSGIYLNQAKTMLANADVRYGIAHALNFDKVINTILRGDYARLNTISDGFGIYTDSTIKARTFDLQKANEYFDRAGYKTWGPDGVRVNKDNQRLSMTISYGRDIHSDRLIILKEDAKKAGLEIKLKLMEPSAFYKHVIEKKHEAAWLGLVGGFRPQYWGMFHSVNANKPQTNNITNTNSPELDSYIDAYRQGTTEATRVEYAHKIQRFIHDEGAFIPRTYVPFIRSGFWRWLQLPDFINGQHAEDVFAPFGEYGGFFWIDETLKKETLEARKSGRRNFEPQHIIESRYRNKN